MDSNANKRAAKSGQRKVGSTRGVGSGNYEHKTWAREDDKRENTRKRVAKLRQSTACDSAYE